MIRLRSLFEVGLIGIAVAGCASVSKSMVTIYPTGGTVIDEGPNAELVRSCRVGDCRVQDVVLTLPDGSVLKGTMTVYSRSATTSGVVFSNTQAAAAGSPPQGHSGSTAIMRVDGEGGQRMECKINLTGGSRGGFGTCKNAEEATYGIRF